MTRKVLCEDVHCQMVSPKSGAMRGLLGLSRSACWCTVPASKQGRELVSGLERLILEAQQNSTRRYSTRILNKN